MLGGGSIEHRELIYYHLFQNRQLFTPRPPVWNWTRVPVTQPPVLLPSKSTLSVAAGHESRCAVKTAEVERGLPRPGAPCRRVYSEYPKPVRTGRKKFRLR